MLMFLFFFAYLLQKVTVTSESKMQKNTILALLDIADKDVGNKASCH